MSEYPPGVLGDSKEMHMLAGSPKVSQSLNTRGGRLCPARGIGGFEVVLYRLVLGQTLLSEYPRRALGDSKVCRIRSWVRCLQYCLNTRGGRLCPERGIGGFEGYYFRFVKEDVHV